MKIKKAFELREIADEYIIVPVGNTVLDFNGLITVNEVGKTLFECLQEDCTEEELLQRVLEEYEVDEETAKSDIREFIDRLRTEDFLSE